MDNHAPSLSALFTPPLIITSPRGTEIPCPPPSHEDGLLLTAIYVDLTEAVNAEKQPETCPTCGQATLSTANPRLKNALETAQNRIFEEIALGTSAYKQLLEEGTSDQDLHVMGMYALFFWVCGKHAADNWVRLSTQGPDAAPKGSKASKTGRRTASGNRTKTASTRTTSSPAN